MAEKYIDLKDEIRKDSAINAHVGIVTALRWLDTHPDQVPGRTITESEYSTVVEWAKTYALNGWKGRTVLAGVGITVIPDPDPTNAEKLGAIIAEKFRLEYRGDPNDALGIGKYLDERGVKAPGGDE